MRTKIVFEVKWKTFFIVSQVVSFRLSKSDLLNIVLVRLSRYMSCRKVLLKEFSKLMLHFIFLIFSIFCKILHHKNFFTANLKNFIKNILVVGAYYWDVYGVKVLSKWFSKLLPHFILFIFSILLQNFISLKFLYKVNVFQKIGVVRVYLRDMCVVEMPLV